MSNPSLLDHPCAQPEPGQIRVSRRRLLAGTAGLLGGLYSWSLVKGLVQRSESVFIAKNQRYDGSLNETIKAGLKATGLNLHALTGKRVLLKPNMVEPTRKSPQMTTHPTVLIAAAEVFLSYGAKVMVGEAPGHLRDTDMALFESGIGSAIEEARIPFVDLNYEDVAWVRNAGRKSPLKGFHFPQTLVEADLVVSMPKMKTHHWVGMTGGLKNMYGILPGIKYGWPKNVLHHAGIPQTVYDINATLPKTITIIDGIVAMEGDGPIMGTAKEIGLLAIGTNVTAVDATVARIMGLDPTKISYLQLAGGRLGPVSEHLIRQQGETWQSVARPFEILDRPELQKLLANPNSLVT